MPTPLAWEPTAASQWADKDLRDANSDVVPTSIQPEFVPRMTPTAGDMLSIVDGTGWQVSAFAESESRLGSETILNCSQHVPNSV